MSSTESKHCHFCMQEGEEVPAIYVAHDNDVPRETRNYCKKHAKYFIESKYYTVNPI